MATSGPPRAHAEHSVIMYERANKLQLMDLILVLVEEEEEDDFVTKNFFIIERLLETTKNISIFTVQKQPRSKTIVKFVVRRRFTLYTYYGKLLILLVGAACSFDFKC